ncbi:leucine-rich repeat domain-containing protein [Aliiroseovarius crassostreae]|uniref:leucine-rich repeat domain-containing protein n=1 Tax=Aliiroseovarius crassostreae TaxID=154981 RepID=UPI0022051AEC|nr:leucine-rich repeat domain-containing protein [Aliiroseovarius crassostreae]UWQ02837.1 leucine-rich repeat domain-containing protein [Aliiroseovarius crassostreae]
MTYSKPNPIWNEDPNAARVELEARLEQDGRFYGGTGQFQALRQLPRNIALLQGEEIHLQYTQVSDLSGLTQVPQLKRITVGASVTDISGIEDLLPNLEQFEMSVCEEGIADLAPLARCPHLKEVKLWTRPDTDLSVFDGKPLTGLELVTRSSHRLPHLPNLKRLHLHSIGREQRVEFDLSTLGRLDRLDRLSAWGQNLGVRGVPETMSELRWAMVDLCEVRDYEAFANCPSLETLRVTHPDINHLRPIMRCPKLRVLKLRNAKLRDISPLRAHPALEEIDISGNPVTDIAPISFKASLKELRAENTPVTSLKGWNRNSQLRLLDLSNTKISDLSPLFGASIFHLSLSGTRVADLTGISKIKSLWRLNISNTQVAQLPESEHHATLFHEPLNYDPRDGAAFYFYNTPLEESGFKLLKQGDKSYPIPTNELLNKTSAHVGAVRKILNLLFRRK